MPHLTTDVAQQIYATANRRLVDFFLYYAREHHLDFEALQVELANLLEALAICKRNAWWVQLTLLFAAIRFLLHDLGYWAEYRYWIESILAQRDILTDAEYRSVYFTLLDDYAALLHTQGETDKARRVYRDIIETDSTIQDPEVLMFVYYGLGQTYFASGELEQAEQYWSAAVKIAKSTEIMDLSVLTNFFLSTIRAEHTAGISVELVAEKPVPRMQLWRKYIEAQFQGRRLVDQGNFTEATRVYTEVIALAEQLHDQDGLALALFELGEIARLTKERARAISYYRKSELIALQLENRIGLSSVYAGIGRLYLYDHRYDLARPYLEECVQLERQFGNLVSLAEHLHLLGYAAANTQDIEYAFACFDEAKVLFMQHAPERLPPVDEALKRLKGVT